MEKNRTLQPASVRAKTGIAERSAKSEIDAFLSAAKSVSPSVGGGRVILALDATMSRQPTWDLASSIQGRMFEAASRTGSLSMQLVYFRGFEECRASAWARDGATLARMMSRIDCRAGHTQIGKVLKHVSKENAAKRVNAVVYIGDCVEEDADRLGHLAGELGVRGVPAFMFQEGNDRTAETLFREIARLSRGGYFRFDRNSPEVLAGLLAAIATYASGGLKALTARNSREDKLLLEQLKGPGRGDAP